MSSDMTIELAQNLVKEINEASKNLGYKPYNNLQVIRGKNSEFATVSGVCPLCGKTSEFHTVEDGKKACSIKKIANPNTGDEIKVNSCLFCDTSRKEQLAGEPKRELNSLVFARVSQILEDKFGAKLISTKSNLFNTPDELITFKKDGNKYKIKLKIIMLFSDISFKDVDAEFINSEKDKVFQYYDEEFVAVDKHTGEEHNIEEFLLHPERDGIERSLKNEEVTKEVTEEKQDEPVVEEPEADVDVEATTEADETEITEDTVEAADETAEPEVEVENTEVEQSEPEPEVTINEPVVEEPEADVDVEAAIEADETEITEDTLETSEPEVESDQECIFGGTSEEVEIGAEVETEDEIKEEERSTESDEITIDDDSSEDSGNNFFSNFFKSFSSPNKEEINSNAAVEETDEITIEADGSTSPFSEASEVNNKTDEDENACESPITSEARKPIVEEEIEDEEDDEEIQLESVSDSTDKSDDDGEVTIELDSVKSQRVTKEKESNNQDQLGSNHTDKIGDEAHQIYENDKKWYNNPVYFGDENVENFNEFMDEVDLISEFKESDLGRVIYEVCKRTGIQAQFTINEDTFEIPVVDFESGVRIICIDCNKVAQMKVNLALMERNLPFAYDLSKKEGYRKIYFYSDALTGKERTKATIKNIIKIVNRDRFNGRRIITLGGNYTLFYTDSIPVIRSFEDENSSYPQGKPCTKEIGIIALRHKSGKHEEFTAKDFMNYLNKNYKMDMKNHNLYMVATARYIVKPEAARQVVKYQITDYCELADSILKDGLDHIIGAIMKEHKANNTVKDPRYLGTNFAEYKAEFEFEFDPSTMPSPSLEIWSDDGSLFRFPDSFEDGQGKCYIRMPEYRANPTDGYRKDPRLFLPIPFSKLFRADIEKAGVNVLNDNARRKFIEQLGFVESYYPRMKRFILNPIKVMKLQFSSSVLTMSKVDLNKFFSGNGVYDGGYDNILLQKFINNSNLDEKTKNMMSYMALSKMLK